MKDRKHLVSFHNRLFITVLALFVLFVGSFIAYQYQREKEYRIELFNTKLQGINNRMYTLLPNLEDAEQIQYYLNKYLVDIPNIKLTIIKKGQQIVFDSFHPDTNINNDEYLENEEIKQAVEQGSAYQIRVEHSTDTPYFFSTTLYPNYIIRSGVPYDSMLKSTLESDTRYLTFSIIISIVLISLFYSYTAKLGIALKRLRKFTQRAEQDKTIQWENEASYSTGELGEITQHIFTVYRKLHATKEALVIEKDKLFAHLQYSREGLGIFSSDKKEILVNKLFMRYCSLISDSNLKHSEEVFEIKELQSLIQYIDETYQGAEKVKDKRKEMTIVKNGKHFVVECIIFDDFNFELSINDITEGEEKKLLKKQLTQNIAHELKTPVSSIRGYLETILDHPNLAVAKRTSFVERCYAQSNRLARLLQDLSILTRIEESGKLFDKQDIDINLLVSTTLQEIELDLEKMNISVHEEFNKQSIHVSGNYSLIYSIFRNLLDNSIAHAGKNIDIFISCYKEVDGFYYFSYRDTGAGIPSEHLNRLFERFYRVDKGRSRKLGGTGLGLAIVKNSVLLHQGSIFVKSDKNKGVEFVFTLPKYNPNLNTDDSTQKT